jgi:hypothetical protein
MANTLVFPVVYSKEYQRTFQAESLSLKVCDTSAEALLRSGDTFKKAYTNISVPGIYSRTTDMVLSDITDTNETLTINQQFGDAKYIDDFDEAQDNKNIAAKRAKVDGTALTNLVDMVNFGAIVNSANTIDDASIGGTAGNSLILTASNVIDVVGIANEKLDDQNVPRGNRVAVIHPRFRRILTSYGIGKDTQMGDQFFKNGMSGMADGFEVYFSTLVPQQYTLKLATNPTNTDTIVVLGQTFTFVSSIGTTAGNVLIGANAAATQANLKALIDAPSVTTAQGVALTGDNLKKFQTRVSLATFASDLGVFTILGGQSTAPTETLTAAADGWQTSKNTANVLFMDRNAISCVMQKSPFVQINKNPLRGGYNYLYRTLFGTKMFTEGTLSSVNCKVRVNY